ncbi:MAG: YkgJ family cysteine cluster protein [Candidatus Helarchaeota archaeon]
MVDEKEEQSKNEENVDLSDKEDNNKEIGKKEESSKEVPKKKKRFVFECTECGACCYRDFPIYFEDLKRWSMDQTIPRVYSTLQIEVKQPAGFQITFKKVKDKDGKDVCPFYTPDSNNRCGIFFSKPISCIAFPLGYDKSTNRYYLVDKTCNGLGKGNMTNEYLKEMRENSKLDYECKMRTLNTLPLLQMIFLQFFNEQTQQVMNSLSPEDREQLEKILEKSRSEGEKTTSNEN